MRTFSLPTGPTFVLFCLLAAFIAGICSTSLISFLPIACYIVAVLLIVATGFAKGITRPLLLLGVFFLIGAGRAGQIFSPAPNDVSCYIGAPSVWMTGEINSLVETGKHNSCTFTMSVHTVNDYKTTRIVQGNLRVIVSGKTDFAPGNLIKLRGRVEDIPQIPFSAAFDYHLFLARHHIFGRLEARHEGDAQVIGNAGWFSFLHLAQNVRNFVAGETRRYLDADDAALLNGVLLSVHGLSPEVSDAFTRTGAVHILSVSGLHMTVFAGAIGLVFRYLLLPRRWASVLGIGCVWLFALASGASAAPVRSAIMVTVFLAAPLVRRTTDALHSLIFSALVVYFADPGSLYDAGCQLSFVSVAGLLWLAPFVERIIPLEPTMPRAARLGANVLRLLLVGGIAELWIAPLTAYHFGRWNPVAPLANLPIVFLSEIILIGGLLMVAVSPLIGALSPVFALGLWWWFALSLKTLRFLAQSFAALPFASYPTPSLSPVLILGYYTLLTLATYRLRKPKK